MSLTCRTLHLILSYLNNITIYSTIIEITGPYERYVYCFIAYYQKNPEESLQLIDFFVFPTIILRFDAHLFGSICQIMRFEQLKTNHKIYMISLTGFWLSQSRSAHPHAFQYLLYYSKQEDSVGLYFCTMRLIIEL